MPQPVETSGGRYLPALDGVRAIAVALVIGYHLGIPWMSGGLLGVGVFFTLSGFLITGLLLNGWYTTGHLRLLRFYQRRARRLLPAVGLVLGAVLLTTLAVDRQNLGTIAAQTLGAVFYVSNWQTIAAGDSYFERFAGPGALDHLWSLAVEEQFYLLWPILLLLIMTIPRITLRGVAVITGLLATASFAWMAVLASPGFDNTRAYEGTDTRAGGLLVGAVAALLVWRPPTEPHPPRRRGRRDLAALLGLAVIGVLVAFTDEYSMVIYRGGLLLLSLATVAVLVVVVDRRSMVGKVLGVRPLTWVGERSYGIYLWHMPIVAFTPATVLADAPVWRGTLQVGLTVAISALSWTLVEDPIRRLGFRGAMRRTRYSADGGRRAVPAIAAAAGAVVLVATTAFSAQALVAGTSHSPASDVSLDAPPLPPKETGTSSPTGTATPTPTPTPTPTGTVEPGRTSCTQLVHVGDSTSIGLMDPAYQPDPKARIDAQYARIGITDFQPDILGARSIVERYKDQPNAETAVKARTDKGYDGCWVIAMGVNEAANIAVGGPVGNSERIDRIMRHIPSDAPVMWLTVKTLRTSGPYQDANMQKFDKALVAACTKYPNLRIYDWRSEVSNKWFINDDIHYTTTGYKERAKRIADAFARAFPRGGSWSDPCLVRSGD